MKNLGLDGLMVELPTVPHAFLREVPLVDGHWLDRYVVALAEWGARLVQQDLVVVGYLLLIILLEPLHFLEYRGHKRQ